MASEPSLAALMQAAEGGSKTAADALFSGLYSELRRLAKRELARHGALQLRGEPNTRNLSNLSNSCNSLSNDLIDGKGIRYSRSHVLGRHLPRKHVVC